MLKIRYIFALYVNSIVFYWCVVLCLWKCWYCGIYLGGREHKCGRKTVEKRNPCRMGFMEFSGHFAGIYVAYVFHKDEVESYRVFREHCFLPCSPDF